MHIPKLTFFLSVLILFSCTNTPKSHEAEVGAPLEKETIESATVTYKADLDKSILGWVGTKLTGRHVGHIPLKEGLVHLKKNKIVGGNFIFDLKKLTIDDLDGELGLKLYNHLQSDDFFATDTYPEAKFELVEIKPWEADTLNDLDPEFTIDEPSHRVIGNLTLRGKTLGVTFPAHITMSDSLFRAQAKFNIDRTRWGVSYHSESSVDAIAKDKLINDKVNINLDLIAKK